ncbi:undecaprenyldiphospho-muramoylpentapeptide beta-N-acetylglucosaminyltransferase [Odoribacter sp. OttesenSCG-928-L07]|nr:undecaprenyldiphospho-muramoylpentapeptide beta-N-acetylglucosaminyltransferase [Odoribacter sp. OttesenSCG-928-L07]MDL2239190.1 undecaprenyldiphospho-muramoylpentapeptide beta-N-acetylglucosaminyltransferase [Bacteroidales bacterium OttesenSCG-928-L14]MDL2240534.1 undecaprenyldiphospho-muramoylpentapeptide beta-N-acetylglucosaminyltransferase [Bacteroidales bacterium OttesenSCG-928-K22]
MSEHRYIISGGGTGGHIFPAIAIANGIKAKYPNAEILFVGAKGKMEMDKVPQAGYEIIGLNITGMSRKSVFHNIPLMFKFVSSTLKSRKILKKFKPNVVIGVGGYASGAVLQAAKALNIDIVIQEQNSLPGKTNKMMANRAKAICVAYDGLEKYFPKEKIVMTGNPIRKEIINIETKNPAAFEYFKIKDDKPVVLIVGGSQGAKAINEALAQNINSLSKSNANYIWQTGVQFYERAKSVIEENKAENVFCYDFIREMNYAYSVADVVVSRAGAIAISELCAVGLPSILVPLPTAAENHQMINAMSLVKKDAAKLVENSKVNEELVPTILELLNNKNELEKLKTNIKSLAITDSVDRIIDVIEKIK